jgi:hypothetical protein
MSIIDAKDSNLSPSFFSWNALKKPFSYKDLLAFQPDKIKHNFKIACDL